MEKLSPMAEMSAQPLLTPKHRILYSGALTAANARALREIGAPPEALHGDPRGQNLRRLRQQQQRDAVSLATEACISLRQLYQLENGETSLFYNTRLRDQAGRRVARLLGADWEALHLAPEPEVADKSLKLVGQLAPVTAAKNASAHAANPAPGAETMTLPMALQRPASASPTVPVPHTVQIGPVVPAQTPQRLARNRRRTLILLAWAFCAFGGMAMGWGIGTYTTQSFSL